MDVRVCFYSYFKDLAHCTDTQLSLASGATISDLLAMVHQRFPALAPLSKSTLIAVGVDYQTRSYILRDGDEVSLFPPVQGG